MSRQEFSVSTKKAAYDRSNGICECGCGVAFGSGKNRPEYDHRIECALGGDNSLENCVVLRLCCHSTKTSTRAPTLAKAGRIERKQRGIKPMHKQLIPGSKGSGFRKRIDGSVYRE